MPALNAKRERTTYAIIVALSLIFGVAAVTASAISGSKPKVVETQDH